jgi:hypothetical protein
MTNITFVTAFMNVYKTHVTPYQGRDIQWRLEHFIKLAESGIYICIYVDENGEDILRQFIEIFPETLKIMRVMSIYETWVHRICQQYDTIGLPRNRNDEKDIYEYMVLMNSKIEFVYDAINRNPFKTKYFAWIDFNVAHVFKDVPGTQSYLKLLSSCTLPSNKLWIPGCWSSLPRNPSEDIIQRSVLDGIHWRFCGGFFLGAIETLKEFHTLYETYFPEFIFRYRQMVWEVNFWSWLESILPLDDNNLITWQPFWFAADHDDSIVKLPLEHTTICLKLDIPSYQEQVYDYKQIESFVPMSACVVEMQNGQIGLNTRYVNYTLSPKGYYHFHHPEHIIITKNIFSILDPITLIPLCYDEVVNPIDISYKDGVHHGIEDIRLWIDDDKLRYIGTSVSYSPSGKNRIITGIFHYDVNSKTYHMIENKVLEPPTDTYCEKNWVPILDKSNQNDCLFIYQWSPFQIGTIDSCGKLSIHWTYTIHLPLFQRLRGSTAFSEYNKNNDFLIGLAHFSDKEWPRSYYHILILLDKKTYKPFRCTQPFSFCKQTNIEYCIGFLQRDDMYHFWISQFDRDAQHITVKAESLPFIVDL